MCRKSLIQFKFQKEAHAVAAAEDAVAEERVKMKNNFEKTEKDLLNQRIELKEQFLREEISAEEYNSLKDKIEKELDDLEKKKEIAKKTESAEDASGKQITEDKKETNKHFVHHHKHKVMSNSRIESKAEDDIGNSIKENQPKNIWKYASILLAISLIIVLGVTYIWNNPLGAGGTDKSIVANKAVDYINANLLSGGAKASLTGIEEKNGVYLLKLDVNGTPFESYAAKDGSLLFPSGVDIRAAPAKDNINAGNKGNADANTAAVSADDDPSIGPENASVTIIEFSDFQCPFCTKAEPVISQILENYKGKVRFVYRDFPLSFHQYAQKAAEASECADEQGKFWKYHDTLFEKQSEWSSEGVAKLKEYAADLGLNAEQFNKCLDSGKYASEVQKDFTDGQEAGVSGTPAFFINGKALVGAQPFEAFQQIIEQELSK